MKQNIIDKLEKLDRRTDQLIAELAEISSEDLSKRQGSGWSLLQVLAHLNMAESASLMYMKKKIHAGDKMHNIGWGNRLQMKLTNLALASSLKWRAPSYVANIEEPKNLEEVKAKWRKTRNEIKEFVMDYPEKYMDKLVYKHPMGGRQNLNNAIDSFVYHQKHHLHQIKRIKKSLGV